MDIKAIGVEEWLNVWEKSATWDIAQSTISSLTMGELRALDEQDGATFYERLDREKMNYGWIEGSPEFKAEVAKLYRREVNPDHILQTNGCTGANLNAIMAVVEPGDHVIAEWPTYAPLYEIPRALGAEVEYWELREELGWKPDIEPLKRLVRPNTKLICINNASNPIGTVLDADMLGRLPRLPVRWAPTCCATRCICRSRTPSPLCRWPTCTRGPLSPTRCLRPIRRLQLAWAGLWQTKRYLTAFARTATTP